MVQTQSFDNLNNLISVEFERYFNHLPENEKQRRVDYAWKFWECWLFFTTLLAGYSEYSGANQTTLILALQSEMLNRVGSDEMLNDKYFTNLIASASQSIVNTTLKHPESAYYTSDDRGIDISNDMAERVGNYEEFVDALNNGKTTKIWNTMDDDKVRESHVALDGTEIAIDGLFDVGGSLMRFPKDEEYGADETEIINCRCYLTYR